MIEVISNYIVKLETTTTRIPFRDKNGDLRMMRRVQNHVTLTRVGTMCRIRFTKHKRGNKIYWRDDRIGSCTKDHVIKELMRMLRITSPDPVVSWFKD